MSRVPLDILVPDHGHGWNAAVVSIAMVWSICVIQGGFTRCPGSPWDRRRLFLGPGSSRMSFRFVNAVKNQGGCSFGSFQQ